MAAVETISHVRCDNQGVAWIDDTNVKVLEVVSTKLAYNLTPEELVEQYPHLSLGQVYGALAYYYDHKDEIDREMAQRARLADELRSKTEDADLQARLREIKEKLETVSLALYMDVHVHAGITRGLRTRGVDVLRPQEDNAARLPDPELLTRASQLGRLLFSQDEDLLAEAARRQAAGDFFAGVVYARQGAVSVGACIRDLEIVCKVLSPAEIASKVIFLPL